MISKYLEKDKNLVIKKQKRRCISNANTKKPTPLKKVSDLTPNDGDLIDCDEEQSRSPPSKPEELEHCHTVEQVMVSSVSVF